MWNKKLLQIAASCLAGAVLVGALVYYNFIDKAEATAKGVGDVCPEIALQTYKIEDGKFVEGGEAFVLSEVRGKPVVLNFWATWCGSCIAEIPHFNEFYEENSDKVEMVIINTETEKSMRELAENYLNSPDKKGTYGEWNTYSCTFGKYEENNNVKDKFFIEVNGEKRAPQALPVTVIVDKEGTIQYIGEGDLTKSELETLVLPLTK